MPCTIHHYRRICLNVILHRKKTKAPSKTEYNSKEVEAMRACNNDALWYLCKRSIFPSNLYKLKIGIHIMYVVHTTVYIIH